jgi:hypothetical protein
MIAFVFQQQYVTEPLTFIAVILILAIFTPTNHPPKMKLKKINNFCKKNATTLLDSSNERS